MSILLWLLAGVCTLVDWQLYYVGGVAAQLAFGPVLFVVVVFALMESFGAH